MSLVRQLWLAIGVLMLLAFGGSFVFSSLSAKHYLEEQLLLKNIDNATSLASSLSQMPKDEVTVELLIAAQFDGGHYRSISIVSPDGDVLVEKRSSDTELGAPDWFVALFPIDVAPGVAQVQDGWTQYGTLTLESHYKFAYRALWDGTLQLLAWFFAAAVVAALLGTWSLRLILRPLDDVVSQAEALGARRFISVPEPATAEFRTVVRSMNELTRRVKQMLEDESSRLEQLRRDANIDPVTELLNRGHFVSTLQSILEREDSRSNGVLVIARLMHLMELNKSQGWAVMDALIKRFAGSLRALSPEPDNWVVGRLNGSDFAIIAVGESDASMLGHRVADEMASLVRELDINDEVDLPVGVTRYGFGESLGDVLARTDAALATAVDEGGSSVQTVVSGASDPSSERARQPDAGEWKALLQAALAERKVRIHTFPVNTIKQGLLHAECVARMQLGGSEDWLSAGQFMPWLSRLTMSPELDMLMLELALEQLPTESSDLCLNVSAQTLHLDQSVDAMIERLASKPGLAPRIWLEVPEHGVFQYLDNFRRLCGALKPLGVRIGIEHAGHQVTKLGLLHDLGLDYLKVDSSFISQIDSDDGNKVFLRGLALIAHSIGLDVVAEGVRSEAEYDALVELGFDGVTGPYIS